MLSRLGELQTEYVSDSCDIATEFYNPCLSASVTYDRITGFFSSTAFLLTWKALSTFVLANEGKIRIICSPRLSEQDADGLVYGYKARSEDELSEYLSREMRRLLESEPTKHTAQLLAGLVASGTLDLKLARVARDASVSAKRMFHDKVGLFGDSSGNHVGFRGSMNESLLGMSPGGNIESIDVWPSWAGGRDSQRVANAKSRFNQLWEGSVPGVEILELPNAARQQIDEIAEGVDVEEILYLIATGKISGEVKTPARSVGNFDLRDHQHAAVEVWESNGRRSIFEHATGSGKTRTGLHCMKLAQQDGLTPVVLVPSDLLLKQWNTEIREILGSRVVLCGGGNDRWGPQRLVRAGIESGTPDRPIAIVAVLNSAATPEFISQVRPIQHRVMLLADEVHRIGSPTFRSIMNRLDVPARLGLSATPERAGDPDGTDAILRYFDGVGHRYGIGEALADKVLVPYTYDPEWVSLTPAEHERWACLTDEVKKLYAISVGKNPPPGSAERLKKKLIERARVAKNAEMKIEKSASMIARSFDGDGSQRWLVYCDNETQLEQVRAALSLRGIQSWKYTSQMEGDERNTLKLFEEKGGVVVSIRCLDEGVNIPSTTHALILASSKNPREFIQRRGRVLRQAPGKSIASILDVLVLPEKLDPDDPTRLLAVGELARSLEFAEWATGTSAKMRLSRRWIELGLPLDQLNLAIPQGFESDEESADMEGLD
ncbi:DEAD/DEAH box helicase family protein [Kitasatospora saccharophila]|uniref:DEAD/DEAH box helicase family protein n=1 Tax=Kitasatospora saccharophila TaxID=407973 RepID=A0ABN2Y8W0_9ACTN